MPPPTPVRPVQPPPIPQSDDPNFPHLSHPSTPTPPKPWVSPPGKPATAAEIVASNRAHVVHDDPKAEEEVKRQAELEWYSKLVPTASAVPRNPRRGLGGGGLRATGSVAAGKTRIGLTIPSGGTSLSDRKEPRERRLKSLSSEASRPQLERKIATSTRSSNSTPDVSNKVQADAPIPNGTVSDVTTSKERKPVLESKPENKGNLSSTSGTLNHASSSNSEGIRSSYLKGVTAIYGKVAQENTRASGRMESNLVPRRRTTLNGLRNGVNHASKQRSPPARKLDEAFNSANRKKDVRSPSPVAMRRNQIGALRRNPSSTQGLSASRKHNKEILGGKAHQEPINDAPPGFEPRSTSTASCSSFVPRRSDPEPSNTKVPDRENAPTPPPNARADAFREAINSRRVPASQRPPMFRRGSKGDMQNETGKQNALGRSSPDIEVGRASRSANVPKLPAIIPSHEGQLPVANLTQAQNVCPGSPASQERPRDQEEDLFVRKEHSVGVDNIPGQKSIFPKVTSVRQSRFPSPHCPQSPSTYVHRDDVLSDVTHDRNGLGAHFIASMTSASYNAASNGEILQQERLDSQRMGHSATPPLTSTGFRAQGMNGWSQGSGGHETQSQNALNGLPYQNGQQYIPPPLSSSLGVSSQLITSSMAFQSSADAARLWREAVNVPSSAVLSDRADDVLLPPLPNAEDDSFENMLRSLGWTPVDEDDRARRDRIEVALRLEDAQETANRVPRTSSGDYQMNGSSQLNVDAHNGRVEENPRGPYYSHFQ